MDSASEFNLWSYAQLAALYNGPKRKYHNQQHVDHLLATWENLKILDFHAGQEGDKISRLPYMNAAEESALQCAIIYHDAFYCLPVRRGFNEEMSQSIFRANLQVWSRLTNRDGDMGSSWTKNVYNAIRATAHHADYDDIPEEDRKYTVSLLMMDLDLFDFSNYEAMKRNAALLILEAEAFGIHATQVVSWNINFYRKLLARDRIYHTDFMRHRYEALATKNIQMYLNNFLEMMNLNTVNESALADLPVDLDELAQWYHKNSVKWPMAHEVRRSMMIGAGPDLIGEERL